jgi:hypothetical protein
MLFIISSELARLLDISERRVNQIAKEGIIFKRDPNGKFDAPLCIEAYYRSKFSPDELAFSFDREKTLHERAKREKAEIELAKIKGKMYQEEDIELAIVPMLLAFRNRILAIAPMIAEKLVGRSSKEIEMILDKTNKEALTELSEYDQIQIGSSEYEVVAESSDSD